MFCIMDGTDTANRIQNASTNVLETILCHDTCDVDIRNRNGDTPLHVAVRNRWEGHEGLRRYLGASFWIHDSGYNCWTCCMLGRGGASLRG